VNALALPPTEAQLDALRELANVGCGQAANALSRLLGGRRVGLSVPRALVVPLGEITGLLGGPGTSVVAVTLGFSGTLRGQLLLVLPEDEAHRLSTMLTGELPGPSLSALGRSALSEVANILASACLNAISRLVRAQLLPSPPSLQSATAQAVVQRALESDLDGAGRAVVLEAQFQMAGSPGVEGQLLVIPDATSLPELWSLLGV
jgi:chemotaxis protein CheC